MILFCTNLSKFLGILRFERFVTLELELANLALDLGLLDSFDILLSMHRDAQRLTKLRKEIGLVQLRIPLQSFVLHSGGEFPKLRNRLLTQFFVGIVLFH
ncbi:MAG: hypothetical protein P8Y94_06325 [Acidobacteriota bacterium]